MRNGWIDPKKQLPEENKLVVIYIASEQFPDSVIPNFGKFVKQKWLKIAGFGKWDLLAENESVYAWEPIKEIE